MNIEELKEKLPDFAKDTKLNFASILTEEGSPDLSQKQIYFIALGSTFAIKNKELISTVLATAKQYLSDTDIQATKAAATIMSMNNIYYRFVHLSSDKSFASMPAKLRMNVISNPGIEKTDFELISLAVSALNGCGMCIDAHVNGLIKAGVSKLAIQSTVRIASVLNAAAMGLELATI